jgi:glyoxylase-like metal-dependent hydrolase (beta-lactamase superfamily II)
MACKINQRITLPRFTYVDNQFTYRLGNEILTFIHVPGHTPGSCIIDLGDIWFTGDTIYSRGIGLSSIPGSSTEDLRKSINAVWDELDTSRVIYPGHGEHSKGSIICKENHSLLNFLDKKA